MDNLYLNITLHALYFSYYVIFNERWMMNSEVRVAQKVVKQHLKITKVMERKSNNCWKVINLKIPLESMTVWSFHWVCAEKAKPSIKLFPEPQEHPWGGRKRDKGFSFTSNGLRELAQLKFAATHVKDVVCKGQSLSGDLFSCSSPGCAKVLESLLKVCAVKTTPAEDPRSLQTAGLHS